MSNLRFAFAGDRDVAVDILEFLVSQGDLPAALLLSGTKRATHHDELLAKCPFLPPDHVLRGPQFREPDGLRLLRGLNLDFIIGVHFPYLLTEAILSLPRVGVLNLHPSYLPYARGWHTPTWAILEDTPCGATLHFMDEDIDTGDIVHQREISVSEGDTAHSLYHRVKRLEVEVFKEAWPDIKAGTYSRTPQRGNIGTVHNRKNLFRRELQELDMNEAVTTRGLLRQLRALTTNKIDEAAYFDAEGKRYRIRVQITETPLEG